LYLLIIGQFLGANYQPPIYRVMSYLRLLALSIY